MPRLFISLSMKCPVSMTYVVIVLYVKSQMTVKAPIMREVYRVDQ